MKLHKLSTGDYVNPRGVRAITVDSTEFTMGRLEKHRALVDFGNGLAVFKAKSLEAARALADEIANAINEAAEQEKRDWPLIQAPPGDRIFMSARASESLKKSQVVVTDGKTSITASLEPDPEKGVAGNWGRMHRITQLRREKKDLAEKFGRLNMEMNSAIFTMADAVEQSRMTYQRSHMREYLRVLEERIAAFGGEEAK